MYVVLRCERKKRIIGGRSGRKDWKWGGREKRRSNVPISGLAKSEVARKVG